MKTKIISIDSESLDLGYQEVIKAAIEFVKDYHDTILRIYVLNSHMNDATNMVQKYNDRIVLISCKSPVATTMDTKFVLAKANEAVTSGNGLAFYSGYSMIDVLFDLYTNNAHSVLIPGHVGHIVFLARFMERHFGLSRPTDTQCLVSNIPNLTNRDKVFLDLGGLVNQDLYKLAIMGSLYAKHFLKIENPKVGFLNIGSEFNKGKLEIKQAAEKYKIDHPDNVFGENGFIEPDQIYMDNDCNVIVSDGFTGNCVLKASEGASRAISKLIKHAVKRSFLSHLLALPISYIMKKVSKKLSPDRYAAALVFGFNHPIVKCHGSVKSKELYTAMITTRQYIQDFPGFLKEEKGSV